MSQDHLDRRGILSGLAALGLGTAAFQRSIAAQVQAKPTADITPEMIAQAEWIAGITLTEDDRATVAKAMTRTVKELAATRKLPMPNSLAPAFVFDPALGVPAPRNGPGTFAPPKVAAPARPEDDGELAFLDIASLAAMLRAKTLSSVELTKLCLVRLKKYDPTLKCVVTFTDDLALKQAAKADEELAAGKDRGLLHGIPYGAKDLMSVPGYPTTWGAEHYKAQQFDTPATAVVKLQDAGAVLAAKLTLGALALGDVWFGGTTRNPWNTKQGSSGSSAGSCSAVAAGLLPFAIGSETLGSIISPSTRCGTTGLRPTFGRISRAGCMTLCWTMDKLGPITRSATDAAIVFRALLGADEADPATVSTMDYAFNWPSGKKPADFTVGYVETATKLEDRAELAVLQKLGVKLVAIKLPTLLAGRIVGTILNVECAAAFDELPRAGVRDGYGTAWRSTFQEGQFVPAVEYLRANRLRTQLCKEMQAVMKTVDVYVGGNDLAITNLTGHPSICMPSGWNKTAAGQTPKAITFTGRLFDESTLLELAAAYQSATDFHLQHPKLDG